MYALLYIYSCSCQALRQPTDREASSEDRLCHPSARPEFGDSVGSKPHRIYRNSSIPCHPLSPKNTKNDKPVYYRLIAIVDSTPPFKPYISIQLFLASVESLP